MGGLMKLGALAVVVGVGLIAWAWQRKRKAVKHAEPDHARKRRASFEEDMPQRTSKRRETEEVSIHAAATTIAMSGSVPDMSANWAAKVAVTAEQQADASALGRVYQSMAQTFLKDGFIGTAIEAQRQYYGDLDTDAPKPLHYEDFKTPMEKGAVRLGIILLPNDLAHAAAEAASAVRAALPAGCKPHATPVDSLHITIYMTSQPSDPRPDPFINFGGGQSYVLAEGRVPACSPSVLEAEQGVFRQLAASTPQPTLEVHSVVFAASGTLLLCLVDVSSVLAGMRGKIRKAFPGGPLKQSSIFHVSLLRVLEPQKLTQEQREAISEACKRETQRLKGTRFNATSMWHVQEWQFTTVQGKRVIMPFAKATDDTA